MMLLKNAHNAKIRNIKDKTPDITNFAATPDAKINKVKNKVLNSNYLPTTTALTAIV